MATEPNATELANGCATIRIAGRDWPVPLLAFRQNKIVVPALIRLGKPEALSNMSEASMNDLGTAIFVALSRAHPSLTRNEFEDMPISTAELIGAIDAIANQTGLLVPGEAKKPMPTATESTSTT